MKYLALILLLVPFVVSADPRMEVNDNFCHFMHDNANDDNETFVANASPVISVNDDTGTANGFCLVKRKLHKSQINHEFKVRLDNTTFPGETCRMVESNGTQYNSDEWYSNITVKPLYYRGRGNDDRGNKPRKYDYVIVKYEIGCLNGTQ